MEWSTLRALRFRREAHPRERRRHERFTCMPLTVSFNGGEHSTADWSVGGFRVNGLQATLVPGDRIAGKIDGLDALQPADFRAEVAWRSPEGDTGFRILEISPAFLQAMSEFDDS